MKRRVMLFSLFFVFLIFFMSGISAELNSTQITKGYSCIQNKTSDCSSALDDNIFTLLSIKTCKNEVLQASSNGDCWPSGSCSVKQTAQGLLALKESGSDTTKPKSWLLSHTKAPTNIKWFLQIESPEATRCTIKYRVESGDLRTHSIVINESKKIDTSSSSCLQLAQDNYWLEIIPQCQKYEFEISCDKEFVTSKLFKETSSSTIQILDEIKPASSGGTTTEKVNSLCFAEGTSCNYEGTLWASYVLNAMGEEISPYIPYLVVMADDNPRTLPQSFLYMLLGETYLNDLLLKQRNSQYWEVSGDRYYDTALALLALRPDDSNQKADALDWLENTQGADGCWQNSIKNTAFLLYAISPRAASTGGNNTPTKPDCETAGYSCIYSSSCRAAGGNVLDNYQCSLGLNCCDREPQALSCVLGQGGQICDSDEECVGGIEVDAADTGTFTTCCVNGVCRPKEDGGDGGGEEENTCIEKFGTCRSFGCNEDEEQNNLLSCDFSSEICCIKKSGSNNYLWVWILVILIILTGLAIVFRDKLKTFWLYIKTKFGPSGPSSGTHSRPSYFPTPVRRMMPRRIMSNQPHPVHSKPVPPRRHGGELDEVLKKLKDMSK